MNDASFKASAQAQSLKRQPGTATQIGYMPGFGNDFETESLPGALPVGRNSPRRCPYGLYAEQLSGSPFHGAHRDARAFMDVSHSPIGQACPTFFKT